MYQNLTRSDLRALIFHLLYSLESFDYQSSLESIVDNLNRGFELDIPLDSEAIITTKSIIDNRIKFDKIIEKNIANWRLDRIGIPTKLILYIAIWEMLNTEIPTTVIINEAVELSKCFSEMEAFKFVNGVLDEIVKKLPEIKEEVK